jgi:putative hemolysin
VTETIVTYAALLIITLVLNFINTAARVAVGTHPLIRFHLHGDPREAPQNRTSANNQVPYSRAGLYMAQGLFHFLLAGFGLLLAVQIFQEIPGLVLIFILLVFGAIVVLSLETIIEERVKKNPEEWYIRLIGFTRMITFLLYPFLLITVEQRKQFHRPEPGVNGITDEELRSLMDSDTEEGLLEQEERKMITSIFRLGNTLAREIMIPRIDMTSIEAGAALEEAADCLLETGHSRMPVYEETIDNILGLLYAKDLLPILREGSAKTSLRELLRPAYFVPEAKKVDELLAEMQARRIHMAIVVDEYGGVAGLVTLEDIVEEIVGEIQDEYDQAEESPYQELGSGEYIFQGRVDLDDFNEIMGSYLPPEEADTIGGFIYNRIGRVPSNGESLEIENLVLSVEQVSGRRIRKVRAYWAPAGEEEEREESDVNR